MGVIVDHVLIKLHPDVEIKVSGSDIEIIEVSARIIAYFREKHILPDVEIIEKPIKGLK